MNSAQQCFQHMLSLGNSPQQILQAIIQQNPQMQIVINQIQQSGMTPEQFIMQIARQRGINLSPQSLQQTMNQLRGMVPR